MDPTVRAALDRGGIIDITTTGRRSGEPRRIEIVFHNVGGRIIISGMPARDRTRAWIRNLEADPRLTVHLKGSITATCPPPRGSSLTRPSDANCWSTWPATGIGPTSMPWSAWSPLIEVSIPGYAPAA